MLKRISTNIPTLPAKANPVRSIAARHAPQSDQVQPLTKEQISALMSEMGRKGGRIGGKRRLLTMSAQQRQNVARNAAKQRWNKKHELE